MNGFVKGLVVALLVGGTLIGVYKLGQKSEKKITWFSELSERTRGQKLYLIDTEVICGNGKDLGKFQVDLNLANGKIRIVRNDAGLEPSCSR
jgi:hypothetical protein